MLKYIIFLTISVTIVHWLNALENQKCAKGKKVDADDKIDNETWIKAKNILNSHDIQNAGRIELYKIIDELAVLDSENLSTDIKKFSTELIRSALIDYKDQINRMNFVSQGSTTAREVLSSDLTNEEINKAQECINNGEEIEPENNSKSISKDDEKALGWLAFGLGWFLGGKVFKNKKHTNKNQFLNFHEYYVEENERDL